MSSPRRSQHVVWRIGCCADQCCCCCVFASASSFHSCVVLLECLFKSLGKVNFSNKWIVRTSLLLRCVSNRVLGAGFLRSLSGLVFMMTQQVLSCVGECVRPIIRSLSLSLSVRARGCALHQGDGTELSFLSPQALKQLEKEKIIMEKKKLRQQKRQVRRVVVGD